MDNCERIWWIIYFVILFLITPIGWIISNSIHDHKSNNNDDDVDIAMQTSWQPYNKEIEKDHKKYYCEYCGSKVNLKETNCKNCGAPINPNIRKKG